MTAPSAIAKGNGGTIEVGGLSIGRLAAWHIVMSPTTGKPTLFGEGHFKRYYVQAIGGQVQAMLIPSKRPYRIGRPKPPAPAPFVLTGKLFELTAGKVTISEGEILPG